MTIFEAITTTRCQDDHTLNESIEDTTAADGDDKTLWNNGLIIVLSIAVPCVIVSILVMCLFVDQDGDPIPCC